jgi:hypothetical protein
MLGVIALTVLLILVILYQTFVLTEGFKFGVTTQDSCGNQVPSGSTFNLIDCKTLTNEKMCNNSAPLCMWNKYSTPQKCVASADKVSDEDRQGVTGLLSNAAEVHNYNIATQAAEEETESTYASYKPSAADRKKQRNKLLKDIRKIVHKELADNRPSSSSKAHESCDDSPSIQQGCEMEDNCYNTSRCSNDDDTC